eukprot:758311-Hanusia_phi.AAC.5
MIGPPGTQSRGAAGRLPGRRLSAAVPLSDDPSESAESPSPRRVRRRFRLYRSTVVPAGLA